MNSFTNKEYFELCQKLAEQQYDDALDDYNTSKMEWSPAEPEAKEKIIQSQSHATIDLTHVTSSEIRKQVLLFTNFKVGKFKLHITRLLSSPDEKDEKMTASFKVWEERNQTPNGMPCKMDFPVRFDKDNRFTSCAWVKYFGKSNEAHNVSIEKVADILRWFQGIQKLSAFL
jgi:hypothetical protein